MSVILKEIKGEYNELLLHKANTKIICALPLFCLKSIKRSLSEIDEISIVINKYYGKDNSYFEFYNEFRVERLISLDGEYFVIKECTENKNDNTKTIKAYGLEKKIGKNNIVLSNIGIMLNDSDYTNGDNIIINLNDFMYQEIGWRFGHIDEEVLYSNYTKESLFLTDKEGNYIYDKNGDFIEFKKLLIKRMRWQEDLDVDWYTFITETLSEEFDCVPVFDRINKVINLYYIDNFGDDLKIVLSYDNYVKSLEKIDNSSDIVTRLTLIGNEEKCIVQDYTLNGKDYIEDYSYFINNKEMSDELITALAKHDEIINSNKGVLKKLRDEKTLVNEKLTRYKTEWFFYIEYNKQLKEIALNYRNQGNIENATNIELQLSEGLDKEAIYKANVSKCESQIDEIDEKIKQINIQCNRESCLIDGERLFSDELIRELKDFTYYDTYSNDAFYDAQEIIETGKRELELKCKPTREINIDIENFINRLIDNGYRQHWNGTLGLGDIISIYDRENDIEELFYLVNYEYTFDDKNLVITLSNKKIDSSNKKVILDNLKNAKADNKQILKNRRLWNLLKQNKINID